MAKKTIENNLRIALPPSITQKTNREIVDCEQIQSLDIAKLLQAIDHKNVGAINELKAIIPQKQYFDTLLNSCVKNTEHCNDEIVKFLLTYTEIGKCNWLKAELLEYYLNIYREEDCNSEITTLLLDQNQLAHKALFNQMLSLLLNGYATDDFLINLFKEDFLYINELVHVKVKKWGKAYEGKCSLSAVANFLDRPKLAEHLEGLELYSTKVPDFMKPEDAYEFSKHCVQLVASSIMDIAIQGLCTAPLELVKWMSQPSNQQKYSELAPVATNNFVQNNATARNVVAKDFAIISIWRDTPEMQGENFALEVTGEISATALLEAD